MYPHFQVQSTFEYLSESKNERPFILTRGNYVGTGKYASHWLGDNDSSWQSMRSSISGIYNFQIFGFSLVGADICGFSGNTTTNLCIYWSALGAFYPFSRNHAHIHSNYQFPFNFPLHVNEISKIIQLRYKLLKYLYSCLFMMHFQGGSCFKPYFTQLNFYDEMFLTDESVEEMIIYGDDILIIPCLDEHIKNVNLPLIKGNYFNLLTSKIEINKKEFKTNLVINKKQTQIKYIHLFFKEERELIKVFLLPGRIIPLSFTQDRIILSSNDIQNSFSSLVINIFNSKATGKIILDDGIGLSTVKKNNYSMININFFNRKLIFDYLNQNTSNYNNIKNENILAFIEIIGFLKKFNLVKVTFRTKINNIHKLHFSNLKIKNLESTQNSYYFYNENIITSYGKDKIYCIKFPDTFVELIDFRNLKKIEFKYIDN